MSKKKKESRQIIKIYKKKELPEKILFKLFKLVLESDNAGCDEDEQIHK
jgi:hypothetical protein